jgi:CelD/BcsL family acetyltransferase involved in cellulose biosynthesis
VAPTPETLALDDPRWTSFVDLCDVATPFHHPAWAELLASSYGYRPFVLAVGEDRGPLVAGAPFLEVRGLSRRRRWISLPFTDSCAPLADGDDARRRFTAALAAQAERPGTPEIEVRDAVDAGEWQAEAGAVAHVLEIADGLDATRARFSRSRVVRNINRAEREGVVVRRAANVDDLGAFYALHTRTRRRQGVPVQPRRFFELIWSRMCERGLGSILLADAGGRTAVAGALFLSSGGTTIYKFGASDPEGWSHRPNHLIFWTAIQEACARGDRRFDFGRTDLGNESLRSFKSGWGADEQPLVYSTLGRGARGAAGADGLASRAMGVAFRRGPAWVCRGVGATLYRYAA